MTQYVIYSLLSIFFTGIFYFVTHELILTLVVGLLYCLFFFGIYNNKEIKYRNKIKRTYEAISFINNFIISLSVTNSINTTYEAMKENASEKLKAQMMAIDHLNVETKIEYLNKYFELPLYSVFVNIIMQYVESGTNILEISSLLIHDTRNLENRLHEFELVARRKEKDFITSWGFTFIILGVLEVALTSFVKDVKDSLSYYPMLIFVYFALFLGVYYAFTSRIFDSGFIYKGETNHEDIEGKNRKTKFRLQKRNSNSN